MHVKAFGLMTRHPVKVEPLPDDLRDAMPVDERGRVDRPPRELRAEVFRRFRAALEPLRERGKLGGILLQFPPYIVLQADLARVPRVGRASSSPATSCWSSSATGAGSTTRTATETLVVPRVARAHPRDRRCAEDRRRRTSFPTVVARTSKTAYVRFHGRNASTWNKRTGSAAERFDYLYSEQELRGVGRASAGARARHRVGLRDVQQQRPLRDAVDRPRGSSPRRSQATRRRARWPRRRRTRSCSAARFRRPAFRSPDAPSAPRGEAPRT
mgnify:CR=1 FL=1